MARIVKLDSLEDARQLMVLVQDSVERKQREIATAVYRNCMTLAPVDTGRLRIGFVCSLNEPSDFLPPEGKYPNFSIDTSPWNDGELGDVYYITNNVPYAVMVNNGTVKMAPRRFVERAISVVGQVIG
jgi:hypothetical protein